MQKLVRNEEINLILCIETEPIKIKTGKNNLLQPYLLSRHLLDDHNILNETKNRAESTYLNIFVSLKSGSFWVRVLEPSSEFIEEHTRNHNIMNSQMSPTNPTNVHENHINKVTTVKIVGDFSLIKRDIKSTKTQMRRGLQTKICLSSLKSFQTVIHWHHFAVAIDVSWRAL